MKKYLLILACLLPFSFVSADDLSDVWRGVIDSIQTSPSINTDAITADMIVGAVWGSTERAPFPDYPAINDSCWMMVITADTVQVCDTTYHRENKEWYMFINCKDKVKSSYGWERVKCYPKQ